MKNVVLLLVNQSNTYSDIYVGDNVESLRHKLAVVAYFDDGSAKSVSDYIITDVNGGDVITDSNAVVIEYRGVTTTFPVSAAANPSGIMYDWDFTKSLVDERTGTKAVLVGVQFPRGGSSTGDSDGLPIVPAWLPGSGVRFGREAQGVLLVPPSVNLSEKFFNTTIEIDVAADSTWIKTDGEVRLISFGHKPEYDFYSGILHVSDGWKPYTIGDGQGSPYRGMTDINSIAGHRIGIHITSSGNLKMYVDGVSKGVSSIALNNSYAGIMLGSVAHVMGSYLNIIRITGARIYSGDKS